MEEFLEWCDDKNLIVIVILIFGVLSLAMGVDGSMGLVEKMSYGLLGMAVGKGVK